MDVLYERLETLTPAGVLQEAFLVYEAQTRDIMLYGRLTEKTEHRMNVFNLFCINNDYSCFVVLPMDVKKSTYREAVNQQYKSELTKANKIIEQQAKKIKQHEAALAAFDDGHEPEDEVYELLSNKEELRLWIARGAWHCKKVAELTKGGTCIGNNNKV